jgi:plasmid stability protein
MQDKQKVTLYLPPELHRQLKIRAAIDTESMSAMVEKAITFYLKHPEKVEETEASYGRTHQIHNCPECDAALILQEGDMVSLKDTVSIINEDLPIQVREEVPTQPNSPGEEELVPC